MHISTSPSSGARGSNDLYSNSSALCFKNNKCLRLLVPFLGESEICVHSVSCRKFNNFNQLLIEAFFHIIETFGNIQPQCEPTFSNQYIVIYLFIYLKSNKCLATPSSTPVENRDLCLVRFLQKI